ncbi:peptide chain release factor N(5)-glutamine methyltransferase [Lachnospiraceae bacterium OttesenSCG-928-D06]|nr:peptide chain release factor N(5)-glutamine methyltransferase [Lachnospiraceae bacterium OttesenSCG-928-D06]
MNYRECYETGSKILSEAGIAEASLDARLLLEYTLKTKTEDLFLRGDREVLKTEEENYLELIKKRAEHIPLQYITGEQEFMGLSFQVNEHVLIPRQDTEILVEAAMKELEDSMSVLDMCTGSGCILISLLHYKNGCTGVGVDISREALELAKRNAKKILANKEAYESHITFIESDLFQEVEGKFDMIISNPPYIKTKVVEGLMEEVRCNEPYIALNGHEDGLFFYKKIITESKNHLLRGGRLFFEIGYDQAEEVMELLRENAFKEIRKIRDYAGLDRVVTGIF